MVLMNLFGGEEWRCRYREWTCVHSGGSKEWNERRKYHCKMLTICKTAGEKLPYKKGSPAQCSVMT